jgi:hypothetical protein
MPLFRFGARLVLFVHIPKTGGTSVETMLKSVGGIEALRLGKAIPELPCTPQHFHAALLERLFPPGFADFSFAIVRNPFHRLVSEYRMRVLGRGRDTGFDEWVDQTFARHAKNAFASDNHIRPQHEFVFGDVKVYRYEDDPFADIVDELVALGLPRPASIPWERRSPAAFVTMSEATVDRIRDFYVMDFERFDYPATTEFSVA